MIPDRSDGTMEAQAGIMQRGEPKRRPIRLGGYDYSTPGAYFITACAHNRLLLFGRIINGKMEANRLGAIVEDCWTNLPAHYDNVALDTFILMPNHIHGVIIIEDTPTPATTAEAGLKPTIPSPEGPATPSATTVGAGLELTIPSPKGPPTPSATTVGAGLEPTIPSPEGPATPSATTVGAGLKPALPEADGATNA